GGRRGRRRAQSSVERALARDEQLRRDERVRLARLRLELRSPVADDGQRSTARERRAGERRRELDRGPRAETTMEIEREGERLVDLGRRLAGQADDEVDHQRHPRGLSV